jgi:hypothetical protein
MIKISRPRRARRVALLRRSLRESSLPWSSHMSCLTDVCIHRHVIYKLLGFTFAMVVGPIGTYFLTVDTIFGGWFLLSAEF